MLAASKRAATMRVLIVNESEVESLLTMQECIGVMENALASLARGEVHQPLRQAIRAPGSKGLLGLMPAFAGSESAALDPGEGGTEARGQRPEASYYGL